MMTSKEAAAVAKAADYLDSTGQVGDGESERSVIIRAHRLAMLRAKRTFDLDVARVALTMARARQRAIAKYRAAGTWIETA